MTWPIAIEKMRVRIGLADTDPTRDADILAAQEVAMSMVEDYLDRKLGAGTYEEHVHWSGSSFATQAWPLDPAGEIAFMTQHEYEQWVVGGSPPYPVFNWVLTPNPSNPANFFVVPRNLVGSGKPTIRLLEYVEKYNVEVDFERGIIYLPDLQAVRVRYVGGFVHFPPALTWAISMAFDAVWAGTPGFGAGAGGGGIIAGTGDVKKISLVGVGTLDFDVGATAVGGSTGASSDGDPWSLIPAQAVSILSRYRRESVVGVG